MHQNDDCFYQSSKNPEHDISLVSYEGQEDKMKMWKSGYTKYMNRMPILNPENHFFKEDISISVMNMEMLAKNLKKDSWVQENMPMPNDFSRTIISIESPEVIGMPLSEIFTGESPEEYVEKVSKEGIEIIVAKWGDGFSSPIHGHAPGFIHEELLYGMIQLNLYRLIEAGRVRLVETKIIQDGLIASGYYAETGEEIFKRQKLIHNFKSIGQSSTLHYVPENTRDGRDNQFEAEYFEDKYPLGVKRIAGQEGMYSRIGDVLLVRSTNVPEYEDHYIVVIGEPVMKEHGLRVQDRAIIAPHAYTFLNHYEEINDLILLKLDDYTKNNFYEFHDIKLIDGKVVFPNAD